MKKLLSALLFVASIASAQTVNVTITFALPSASYLKDVEQSRFLLRAPVSNEGTLSSAVTTTTATSIAITGACPANGTAVYIDTEPMLVTAGSGTSTCTVTRNSALNQAGTSAATHLVGATVVQLSYPTAQTYFIQVGVANFVISTIQNLGAASAVIGSLDTTIVTSQTAVKTALTNVAQ